MKEKIFEDIVSKYPELIENGLIMKGRQVSIYGRRIDLIFEDKFKRKLIVELKVGPIKDQHIGQVLSYEGMLLSADDPSIRVMLVGNRVPPNIRRALDHHGIAWHEISISSLLHFLQSKNDVELLDSLISEDLNLPLLSNNKKISQAVKEKNDSEKFSENIENKNLLEGYSVHLTVEEVRQLFGEKFIIEPRQRKIYLEKAKTFKIWANYIAALLLSGEKTSPSNAEGWFEPKDIRKKLREIMPYHYGKAGAMEGSLLTADVKIGSKYNLKMPCLEKNRNSNLYKFIPFQD